MIDPPDHVLDAIFARAGRSKGPIPVNGRLKGAPFVQTLVKYSGAWRLHINGPMLKASGCTVGDRATVEIGFDPAVCNVPIPEELKRAFAADKTARDAFERLTPYRQREILRYLGSLKTLGGARSSCRKALV